MNKDVESSTSEDENTSSAATSEVEDEVEEGSGEKPVSDEASSSGTVQPRFSAAQYLAKSGKGKKASEATKDFRVSWVW